MSDIIVLKTYTYIALKGVAPVRNIDAQYIACGEVDRISIEKKSMFRKRILHKQLTATNNDEYNGKIFLKLISNLNI